MKPKTWANIAKQPEYINIKKEKEKDNPCTLKLMPIDNGNELDYSELFGDDISEKIFKVVYDLKQDYSILLNVNGGIIENFFRDNIDFEYYQNELSNDENSDELYSEDELF